MEARWMRGLLIVGALVLGSSALGAPPGPPTTRAFTFFVDECGEGCLAYNGQVPGPTLDVNEGDTVVLTLVNNITQAASVHLHGIDVAASMDGVPAHAGTALVDSTAPSGGSFTYVFRAPLAGTWHYHDHAVGGMEGSRGVLEGLYGSLVVRKAADERPAATVDLHFLDTGVNGRDTWSSTVPAGRAYEVVVVALGSHVWTVSFEGLERDIVVGPGESKRIWVATGAGLEWSATSDHAASASGTVSAQ